MTSRGLRNNNPFNLDYDPQTKWQGLKGLEPPPLDGGRARFCAFLTPAYGIRAGVKTLLTYQNHDGCKTLRQVINRFAPSVENNTGAYLAAICAAAGIGPDDAVDLDSVAMMKPVAVGIITHENGSQPYTDAQIAEGIRLAGVADAPPPKLATQHTFQAQVGAGVAVVGAGAAQVAQYAPTVKGWADQLSDYTGSPIIQHAVTVMLTVAGGLTIVGIAAQFLKQRTA